MDVTASAQLTRDGWLSLLPLISELFLSYPNLLALVGYSGFYRTRAERNPALTPGSRVMLMLNQLSLLTKHWDKINTN